MLNYIAWFNGSEFRVPRGAVMDVVGQLMLETQTMLGTELGELKVQMTQNIQATIRQLNNLQNDQPKPSAFKDLI